MPRHTAIPPPADLCDLGNIPTTLTQQFIVIELLSLYLVWGEMSTGESNVYFSFGQSSDRKAILRNLLKIHIRFPAGRPSDVAEDHSSDRKAIRGIYSKETTLLY